MLQLSTRVQRWDDARPVSRVPVGLFVRVAPVYLVASRPGEPPLPRIRSDLAVDAAGSWLGTSDHQGLVAFRVSDAELAAARQAAQQRRHQGQLPTQVRVEVRYELTVLGQRQAAAGEGGPAWQGADENRPLVHTLRIDFGFTIVGHTTPSSVTLWATALRIPPGLGVGLFAIVNEVLPPRPPSPFRLPPQTPVVPTLHPLRRIDEARPEQIIGVGRVDGLKPGTAYTYRVEVRSLAETLAIVGQGRFVTDQLDRHELELGFLSCHRQSDEDEARALLDRLRDEPRPDVMLHLGDQIYETEPRARVPEARTFDEYAERYRSAWLGPFRPVLAGQTNYMIFDDHEVADDWGVKDHERITPGRIGAGLEAYQLFQQAHGPLGISDSFHYGFRRGMVAGFVLDARSRRPLPPGGALSDVEEVAKHWDAPDSTVLGDVQRQALRRWADHPATRAADVIVLGSSIPLAWLSVSGFLGLVDLAEPLATGAGGAVGGAAGAVAGTLFPPLGAGGFYVGAALGALLGGLLVDEGVDGFEGEGVLTAADAADLWTWDPHQRDLQFVLDVAFALANDLNLDGTPRPEPRRRAIFVLSGDVHAGGIHVIRSRDPRHRANPAILQITSSGVTTPPHPLATLLAKRIPQGASLQDVLGAFLGGGGAPSDGTVRFDLDPEVGGRYEAQVVAILEEQNVGRLRIVPGPGRRYGVEVRLEGLEQTVLHELALDLDDDPVLRPAPPTRSGRITVHPTRVSFGSVVVGTPLAQTVRITNDTSSPVTITVQAQNGGAFRWTGVNETLSPGAAATVLVTFAPGGSGGHQQVLPVRTTASGFSSISIALVGEGRSAGGGAVQ